ncbi:13775_t:CDS:2 [Gigaspora margarita]|uniref:13775_t:CDS:1 n=1 Tax=Gigaspora margarita TaxID=4874 RepID=A0ABM8VZU9_GIGMA|nr:13775_t:CDS:2 [Gigaspora margarita]
MNSSSDSKKVSNKIVGIDLGTTNSCIAVMEGKSGRVLENREGSRTTPSVVSYIKEEKRFGVGNEAKRRTAIDPHVIFSIKSLMGQDLEKSEVRERYKGKFTFQRDAKDNRWKVSLGKNEKSEEILLTPEQISAHTLSFLTSYAEEKLGEKIKKAVITVPAYFDDNQRKATENAGIIAGLEVQRIINEPTAAALAYGLDKVVRDQKILVYDLGGGTFDVSILQISKSESGEGVFEVLSTAGINTLGGDNFDKRIVDYLIQEFKKENKIDLRTGDKEEVNRRITLQRLQEEAQRVKHELSGKLETKAELTFIASKDGSPLHLNVKITRAKFEDLTRDYIRQTAGKIDEVLKIARGGALKKDDIEQIVLVGGSTRMPMVEVLLEEKFGKKKINKSVNPDEVVAIGAAIQGAVLQGDIKDILLLDVTPLSLGIEVEKNVFDKLIERNTTIPAKKTRVYSNAADNQASVHIRIAQGERERFSDNKVIGSFELGIKPGPRGTSQVEVEFTIDSNGIISVSAQDKQTGKKQSITIEGSQNLSEEEVARMVREAEENREKDEQFKKDEDDPQFQQYQNYYNDLKKAVDEENYEKIREESKKIEELMKLTEQLNQKMPSESKEGKEGSEEEIVDHTSPQQTTTLQKIILNSGLGQAVNNKQLLDNTVQALHQITGQKPVITYAKKSITNFKLREGMPIGYFLFELTRIALSSDEKIANNQGLSQKKFDK